MMLTGTFLDPENTHPHLKGQRALLERRDTGGIFAQFNDRELKEAYGWWPFPEAYFNIDQEVDVWA
jgi:hypothetical protein